MVARLIRLAPRTGPVAMMIVASCAALQGCKRSTPLHVAVQFDTAWRCAGRALSADEQTIVKRAMFDRLQVAFAGFDVRFDEGDVGHVLKVEDTPYTRRSFFGAAGMTYPTSNVSAVRFDALCSIEAGLLGCRDLAHCATKSVADMLVGLGHALASTAAHELGHQQRLRFTGESSCGDCYDSASATTMVHFFGEKHWSAEALTRMRAVLPRTP